MVGSLVATILRWLFLRLLVLLIRVGLEGLALNQSQQMAIFFLHTLGRGFWCIFELDPGFRAVPLGLFFDLFLSLLRFWLVLEGIFDAALSSRRAYCRVCSEWAAVHMHSQEGVETAHILIWVAFIFVWPLLEALQQILCFHNTHCLVSYRQ
jgi:hypothetical protein